MKKICAVAAALVVVGLAGGAMSDETILPVIPFTNVIIEKVVGEIALRLGWDPDEWSLLQTATVSFRDAVHAEIKENLPAGTPDDGIYDEREKELAAARERLLAGPMLLVSFWQQRFVLEIESRGIGKALIPRLEAELRYLRGEVPAPTPQAVRKRAELALAARNMRDTVTAKGGTEEEANERENKAWAAVYVHEKAHGLTTGGTLSREWVERRKKEPGGAIVLAVLAHGVGKILNELKALETERARLPKMEAPAVTAAPPDAPPSAAATGPGRSPFRR